VSSLKSGVSPLLSRESPPAGSVERMLSMGVEPAGLNNWLQG